MHTQTKHFWIFTVVTMLFLIAAQCGTQPAAKPAAQPIEEGHEQEEATADLVPISLAAGEKLQVIATTSIIADVVSQVGSDLIDLTLLLPVGTDPHTFESTPRDLASVADAHLVFANGMGLEVFLDEMIKNAGGQAAVVYLSPGIETRQLGAGDVREHDEPDHAHEGVDPHTWTTPANVIIFVHNIERALSTLDPANTKTYEARAKTYEAELEELDAWVKAQIETIPPENRKLVTDHTTFGYYADHYGLEQVGAVIPTFSTAAETSAQELVALEEAIKAYKVKAIFVGTSVNPSLSEQVAKDTGTQLVTLYTGSLGTTGSGVETYLDYIRYNTETIVEALK